jgi:hypothetical protein
MSTLEELLKAKDDIKDSFNNISRIMVNHLARKYPESYFGIFLNSILIYIEKKPYEPIALFIKHIYSQDGYREKILDMNDSFFMQQTYSPRTDRPELAESKIFETKEIWSRMDEQNKKIIKQTFKSFIDRVDKYVEILGRINDLKKNNVCKSFV